MTFYHLTAQVTLLADVPQPKINGVKSGYAPHHQFANLEYLVSGTHTYTDECLHYPGESILANIVFASGLFFRNEIKLGDRFEISELNRLIGFGVVHSISHE